MTVLDLQHLDQARNKRICKDFSAQDHLLAGDFDNQQNSVPSFKEITSATFDKALSNTVLVIDGFTRFRRGGSTGCTLNDKCHQILLDLCQSKAYKVNLPARLSGFSGFSEDLAQTYKATPDYVTTDKEGNFFFLHVCRLESRHDLVR